VIAEIFGIDGVIAMVVCAVILLSSSQLPKLVKNIGLAGREIRSIQAEARGEVLSVGEAALSPNDIDVQRTTSSDKS
jgi:Sec-independent protein translocase protein TatA